ncbi:MAG TPA: urate oxidase [Granulicella sp.]|nr:urate oxidase [Granulicella sp.]
MSSHLQLAENRYGKSRVRLMKVTHHSDRNDVLEWTVQVLLKGDFEAAHCVGDNRKILPTDTLKNTVYSLARRSKMTSMEAFAMELIDFLLGRNPQLSSIEVGIESALWKRLKIGGTLHRDTFVHSSGEVQTTSVEREAKGGFRVRSGLENLVILKTAHSGFEGFMRDSLTTLPETSDRLLETALTATWSYENDAVAGGLDFNGVREALRETMLTTFAENDSRSVQQTLYAMAKSALEAVAQAKDIQLTMPNKHCLLVDLSRFGQDNPNEIFVPTDEPSGYVEARVRRAE